MAAVFEERKIKFELKISMKEIMFLGHKCVFIKHLTYIFKNSFWKTDLFALYIETCFLACLCLSSFAPRDVRGELFSDSEIARLRSCEIARLREKKHQLKITTVSVAERPNAAMGGTVGGAACRVSSVRVRPETPFFQDCKIAKLRDRERNTFLLPWQREARPARDNGRFAGPR